MKSNTSSTILRRRLITCVSIFLKVLSELITHQLNVLIWHVSLTTAWLHELLFLQCNYRVLFIYSSACKLWGEQKLFKVSVDLLGSTQYAQIVTGFSHISIQIRYAHTLPASSCPSKYVSSHQRRITLCYSPKNMVRKNMVTCYLFFY